MLCKLLFFKTVAFREALGPSFSFFDCDYYDFLGNFSETSGEFSSSEINSSYS